jgi:hypothetical protein
VVGSGYGGTEFGIPVLMPDKKDIADGDWPWMRFADNVKIRWAPQGDNAYECQVLVGFAPRYSRSVSINCGIDNRRQSNGCREPSRRERMRNCRYIREAPNEEHVENVRVHL